MSVTEKEQKQNSVIKNKEPILVISGLHKRYSEGKTNEVHALKGIDLTVFKFCVMSSPCTPSRGRSGANTSTGRPVWSKPSPRRSQG